MSGLDDARPITDARQAAIYWYAARSKRMADGANGWLRAHGIDPVALLQRALRAEYHVIDRSAR